MASASQAVCVSVRRERKTGAAAPPVRPYGLAAEANRIFTLLHRKQTLTFNKPLYEKRLLTYPRTHSNYLTDDMGDTAAHIAALLVGKLLLWKVQTSRPMLPGRLTAKGVRPPRHYSDNGASQQTSPRCRKKRKKYPHLCRGASVVRRPPSRTF